MSALRFTRLSICLILAGSANLYAADDDTDDTHELDAVDVVGTSVDGYDAGMITEGSGSTPAAPATPPPAWCSRPGKRPSR